MLSGDPHREPLRVATALGIGDCHWACTQFRGLSELHGGRPIHAYVGRSPSHVSTGYLEMVPGVVRVSESALAPYALEADLPPSHRDPRWSTLDGCRGWREFDYVLVPNGHLERGEPLATWLPELPVDYSYPLRIPPEARLRATELAGPDDVLLYLSGIGPNLGFHANTWQPAQWVEVMELLNAVGITPVLIGAATSDDRGYRDLIVACAQGRAKWRDIVGRTSIPEICAIIERAAVWIGLNSGTGIVSAMRGTPTVMLWSDSRFPIPGAVEPLHVAMQRSWLTEAQLITYRTLSYGSPTLTPARVVAAALEVIRR